MLALGFERALITLDARKEKEMLTSGFEPLTS